MRNAWNPELVGLLVTIATAILIRVIDHYFPNLVNEVRRVDRSRDPSQPRIVREGEDLPGETTEPLEPVDPEEEQP